MSWVYRCIDFCNLCSVSALDNRAYILFVVLYYFNSVKMVWESVSFLFAGIFLSICLFPFFKIKLNLI